MLHEYCQSALKKARYQLIENDRYYGEIPGIPGVWSEAEDLESCREELAEVFEEWLILSLKRGDALPEFNQIDLNKIGTSAQTY